MVRGRMAGEFVCGIGVAKEAAPSSDDDVHPTAFPFLEAFTLL